MAEYNFTPASRICQAAHYADHLVKDVFHFEATAALTTQHKAMVSSFRTGEESITELILPRLAALFSDVIQVSTYNKQFVEPKYGADWFWILDFDTCLVPMLVQAKRTTNSWAGEEDWSVKFDLVQKEQLELTAAQWDISPFYCIYAPSWTLHKRRFPNWHASFMHLVPSPKVPIQPRSPKTFEVKSDSAKFLKAFVPFTRFCCRTESPSDVTSVLHIKSSQFREKQDLHSLLAASREMAYVRGTAVFKMGQSLVEFI